MTQTPDRIWLDMRHDYLERHGTRFVTRGYLASPPRSEYLLSTPAREHAEEMLEMLKDVLPLADESSKYLEAVYENTDEVGVYHYWKAYEELEGSILTLITKAEGR